MAGGFKASSYVNDGTGFGLQNTTGGTQTLTLPVAVAVGDRIVLTVGAAAVGVAAPTFSATDNVNSGSYTQDVTLAINNIGGSGNDARLSVFSKICTAAGTPIISVVLSSAFTAGLFGGLQAIILTGTLASDPASDGTAIAQGTSASANSGATGATTAANEVVVGAYYDTGENATVTKGNINGSSSSVLAGKHDNDGVNWEGMIEYLLDSGASGATPSALASVSASVSWGMAAVVYKLASGGPPIDNLGSRTSAGVATAAGVLGRVFNPAIDTAPIVFQSFPLPTVSVAGF